MQKSIPIIPFKQLLFNDKPASEFESGPYHMKKFSKAEKCGMTYSVKMFG